LKLGNKTDCTWANAALKKCIYNDPNTIKAESAKEKYLAPRKI
jgi:hypothetical protein